MSNFEIKQSTIFILLIVINLVLSFGITYSLGIFNTVIYCSAVSMISQITYEMVIFMGLSFVESDIYKISQTKFQNHIKECNFGRV